MKPIKMKNGIYAITENGKKNWQMPKKGFQYPINGQTKPMMIFYHLFSTLFALTPLTDY